MLVGARTHAAVPSLAAALRRLGARPEVFRLSGVLAATAPSGRALARALGADPRVAYVERDRELRVAADPFDTVDVTPGGSGIKYTWAYDEVGAAAALAAAGGGSRRTGGRGGHRRGREPPRAGGPHRAHLRRLSGSRQSVTDRDGHGTFVSGLIAAVDGNGIGGKGVAGNTRLLVVRASKNGALTVRALARAIEAAVARGADVMNLSLAGPSVLHQPAARAPDRVLQRRAPRGRVGQQRGDRQPARVPRRGDRRHARTARHRPVGHAPRCRAAGAHRLLHPQRLREHRRARAPAPRGCELGVFSILPCGRSRRVGRPAAPARGSSRRAPCASPTARARASRPRSSSGLAALAWQVQPRLASEQVADVLTRTARQTVGTRTWNERTGAGVVDGGAATALARVYDLTAPPKRGSARRRDGTQRGGAHRARARPHPRRPRAGRARELRDPRVARRRQELRRGRCAADAPLRHLVRLKGSQTNAIAAAVCDRNANCAIKRLGRFRRVLVRV